MKRTPLLFAALVPFVAVASQGGGEQVDYNELRDDLQVTSLLGTNVQAGDGAELGSIEDILIGTDGSATVIIQREGGFDVADTGVDVDPNGEENAGGEEGYEQYQETFDDDEADFGEVGGTDIAGEVTEDVENAGAAVESGAEQTAETTEAALDDDENADVGDVADTADDEGMDQGLDPDRAGSNEMGDDFVKVEWSNIEYDAEEDMAVLKSGVQSVEPVAYEQTADIDVQRNGARASMLIGMEVNLVNEDSFGEVEDVMLDPATGKASALVIDSMEFFDKERYAVPVNLDAVNAEEEELTLQYTQEQLEQMGEFKMEEATNEAADEI